jgi:hypothetical protein
MRQQAEHLAMEMYIDGHRSHDISRETGIFKRDLLAIYKSIKERLGRDRLLEKRAFLSRQFHQAFNSVLDLDDKDVKRIDRAIENVNNCLLDFCDLDREKDWADIDYSHVKLFNRDEIGGEVCY